MDFDGDGLLDILSGSWPGELYLFKRQKDGTFSGRRKLKDQHGGEIKPGSASTVFAIDWDGDGDLDLLTGEIGGAVKLVTNEGSRAEPRYGKPVNLKAGGKPISVNGGDSHAVAFDWDGDGKQDLLTGSGNGDVLFFKNVSRRRGEAPALAPPVTLIQGDSESIWGSGGRKEKAPPRCGVRTKISVCDYNGDGRADLLVGDFNVTHQRLRQLTLAEQATKRSLEERQRKLIEQLQALEREPEKSVQQHDLMEQFGELSDQLSKYQTHDSTYHGWVWLFLRTGGKAPSADTIATPSKKFRGRRRSF